MGEKNLLDKSSGNDNTCTKVTSEEVNIDVDLEEGVLCSDDRKESSRRGDNQDNEESRDTTTMNLSVCIQKQLPQVKKN